MKILEIAFHLAPGGAERFVTDLSNELAKHHDLTLLVLRDESVDDGHGAFYKNEVTSAVKYKNLGLQPGLNPIVWWKIWKALREIKPEIVHFHGEGMPFWMGVPILFSSKKIKFFQTIHNDIHNRYDTGFYKRVYMPSFGKRKRVRFIALSETNYNDLIKEYPYLCSTCIVNGRAPMTLTDKYDYVKDEVNSFKKTINTKTIIHIGRCSLQKNQERLIMAFNRLVSEGYDYQLLIIGSGFDNELGKNLKALSCEQVHFLGTRTNIADYQECADIFCLSSDYEGMPITLIEALMSGTPSVSTPVCGALDAIHSGVNGIIAQDFSDDAYFDALKKACNNLSSLKFTTEAEKDKTPYSITVCAEKYIRFFEREK